MALKPTKALPILISGAGPSSLPLAHHLHRLSIPFRLFERDTSHSSRAQGYRISFSPHGINLLKNLLLPGIWTELEKSCPSIKNMWFKCLVDPVSLEDLSAGPTPLGGKSGPDATKPAKEGEMQGLKVDRAVMRDVLLRGLPEGIVEWGREVVGYDLTKEGVTAKLKDGSEVEGCMLIGADGAKSRIRKQVVGGKSWLYDTKGRGIYGKTWLSDELRERSGGKTIGGLGLLTDPSKGEDKKLLLLADTMEFQPNDLRESGRLPDDYVFFCLIFLEGHSPEAKEISEKGLTGEEAAAFSKEMVKHWDERMRAIVDLQDENETLFINIVSSHPEEFGQWDGKGRVTLIGDAAHAMAPTAGAGALTGLMDADLLTKLFERLMNPQGEGEKMEDVSQVISEYEAQMKAYAAPNIANGFQRGKHMFCMPDLETMEKIEV